MKKKFENDFLLKTINCQLPSHSAVILNDVKIAVGGASPFISIWDIRTKLCALQLSGHVTRVISLVEAKCQILASGSYDGGIKIWNYSDAHLLKNLSGQHQNSVDCFEILKNKYLISGSTDATIKIWTIGNFELLKTLKTHKGWALSICLLASNHSFASAIANNNQEGRGYRPIQIWNLETGKNVLTIENYHRHILGLCLLSNGHLASGSSDAWINIWNVTTGLLVNALSGHTDQVTCLVNLDNKHLASGSNNGEIRIWDHKEGVCLISLKSHLNVVSRLSLFKNGSLLSASYDRTLKIWTLNLNDLKRKIEYGK
jgi:WD40 repeat protein